MPVQFNGQNTFCLASQTLAAFLKDRSIDQQTAGIAIAVNGQIAFRFNWNTIRLKEGDQIEVVHAVSGG